MNQSDEYRQNAAECQQLAGESHNERNKQQWLKLAEHWLKLADATDVLEEDD